MNEPLSKEVLLEQGECCGSTCTNCPYVPKFEKGAKEILERITENLES